VNSSANDIQLRELRDTILQLNNTINSQNTLTIESRVMPVATLRTGSVRLDIYDNASPQFIKNLADALLC